MATIASLRALIAEYTQEKVTEQAYLASPVVKNKIVPVMDKDGVGTVQVKNGGLGSTGTLADGGTLPDGDDVDFAQGHYDPVFILSRMFLKRGLVAVAKGKGGIDYLFQQMESAGRDGGRHLGRSICGAQLDSPSGTVNAGDTSFPVADPSGYRAGATVDFYDGSTLVESGRIARVVIPTSGNSTIHFTAAFANALTGYTAYLRGQGQSAERMTSFADITANATLYSIALNSFPAGALDSSTTTLTMAAARKLIERIVRQCGEKPTHIICNSVNEGRLAELTTSQVEFRPSDSRDLYAAVGRLTVRGIPVVVDENWSDKVIDFHNKNHVRLAKWRDFSPDVDGGKDVSMGMGAVQISQTKFNYIVDFWGAFNLECDNRQSVGRFNALTA